MHNFSLCSDIKIPEVGKIYSFNEGNYGLWDQAVSGVCVYQFMLSSEV